MVKRERRTTGLRDAERDEQNDHEERKWRKNRRRVGAYLTDNVVIVRQVVSVSLGSGRRGVAQFPYVWLRAVGRCGNREAVRLWLAALWAVFAAAGQAEICVMRARAHTSLIKMHHHNLNTQTIL